MTYKVIIFLMIQMEKNSGNKMKAAATHSIMKYFVKKPSPLSCL